MKQAPHILPAHLMGEIDIDDSLWFFSVLSVFSVAK